MSSVKGQRWSDPKPCPSTAAYRRHYRHGEKPCFGCRMAHYYARQDRLTARAEENEDSRP
jgi:hypothetical protein